MKPSEYWTDKTELLRKLLEERGLSCQTHYQHASWGVGTRLYEAMDNFDGTLTVSGLTPEQAIAATLNSRAERTCECVAKYASSPIDGKTIVLHRCSACHNLMRPTMLYCPNCGARVEVGE